MTMDPVHLAKLASRALSARQAGEIATTFLVDDVRDLVALARRVPPNPKGVAQMHRRAQRAEGALLRAQDVIASLRAKYERSPTIDGARARAQLERLRAAARDIPLAPVIEVPMRYVLQARTSAGWVTRGRYHNENLAWEAAHPGDRLVLLPLKEDPEP